MPTYEAEERFWNQYSDLNPEDKKLFREARQQFTKILLDYEARGHRGIPRFPKKLGVTPFVGKPNIMEFAWDDDGRCTWHYGAPRKQGRYHIVWRLIGTHAIYNEEKRRRG
jgi:hypothetical protein